MTLQLEILVPEAVVLSTPVLSVQASDATGRFGLHPGHESFVTVLAPTLVEYVNTDGRPQYAAVDGGVLFLEQDCVSIVTQEAVLADRLDEIHDKAAVIIDCRRRQERQAHAEFDELRIALAKQLARVGTSR